MSAIFISHSSKNKDFAIEVRERLYGRGYQSVFLDVDRDDGIIAGEKWESVLYRELRSCQAIILLMSEDWLTSRWCFAELSHAREKGKAVIGLRLAKIGASLVSDTHAIPFTPEMRDEGYERLWRALSIALDVRGAHKWDRSRLPYPGLLTFEREDAAVYFGRDAAIQRLHELLVAMRRNPSGSKRFALLLGASGSGKSSLVRAGIVPMLSRDRENNDWVALAPFRPGARPANELAKAYAQAFAEYGDSRDWSSLRELFVRALERSDGERLYDLSEDLRMKARRPSATLLISIDQVEEMLGPNEHGSISSFWELLRLIIESHGPDVAVLGTLRSDFLAELQGHEQATRIPYEPFHLESSHVDFRAVIEGPAQVAGIELEAGLVDAMVADTGTRDALPLLAFTLGELWKQYGEDRRLTVEEYRTGLGGLQGSVARAAEKLYLGVTHSQQQQNELRKMFLRLVRVDELGRYVKRSALFIDQPTEIRDIIEQFIRARLLVSRSEDGERIIEVAHDVLFSSWERLAGWLHSDEPFLLWRRRVRAGVDEWERTGRDSAVLLRGKPLNEAEGWFAERSEELSTNEIAFINASIELRSQQRADAEIREWYARLEAARSFYERSFVFSDQRRFQSVAACLLRALELAPKNTAPGQFPSVWGTPAWARAAWTHYGYLDALRAHRRASFPQHFAPVTCVAFAPNGEWVASGSADGTVRLFELTNAKPVQVFEGGVGAISAIAFAPDGQRLLCGSVNGSIVGRDVDTGKQWVEGSILQKAGVASVAFSPAGNRFACGATDGSVAWIDMTAGEKGFRQQHSAAVTAIAFTPDGRRLRSGSSWTNTGDRTGDGSAQVWDLQNDEQVGWAPAHLESVTAIAFSAAATTAIKGFEDGTAQVWIVEEGVGRQLRGLKGHSGRVTCAACSADGKLAATGSSDNTIRVWDTESGDLLLVLEGYRESVLSVAFNPEGTAIVSGSRDKTCVVWDISHLGKPQRLAGAGTVTDIALSANGETVVASSKDTLRLWNVETGELLRQFQNYPDAVTSVAISADLSVVATGCDTGKVVLWDAATGRTLRMLTGNESRLRCVAFSPDGRTIATASDDPSLRVWDVETGAQVRILEGHDKAIHSARFTPDGQGILTASADGTLRLWDVASGVELKTLKGHRGVVTGVSISADGTTAISSSGDKTIRVWDLGSARQTRVIEGHDDAVACIALSLAGRFAVSGSLDRTVRSWDLETGKQLRLFEGHTDTVWAVAISPDGDRVLSASMDKTCRVWDATNGEAITVLEGHSDCLSSVAISADGTRVVTGSLDKSARFWDLDSRRTVRVFQQGHTGDIRCVRFSADAKIVISGGEDRSIRLWDVETGDQLQAWYGHAQPVTCLALSGDGQTLLSGSGQRSLEEGLTFDREAGSYDAGGGLAALWDLRTGQGTLLNSHAKAIVCVAFSPDGEKVATGSWDGTVRLWEVKTARQLRLFRGHSNAVWSVAFSPDGNSVISGSIDRTVRVWDVQTASQILAFTEHTGGVGSIAIQGDKVYSASADQTVSIWRLATGEELRILKGHDGPVTSVAVRPDGRFVLTGSYDRTLILWDAETGEPKGRVQGHEATIWSVAISPDGKSALSGSDDGTLRLWDLPDGSQRQVFRGPGKGLGSVSFSPDRKRALAASMDGTISVWDLNTSKLSHAWKAHEDGLLGAAFSPDGKQIVSGADDSVVCLWDAETGSLQCASEGRGPDVHAAVIGPDGRTALLGLGDCSVSIWDVQSGEDCGQLEGHSAPVTCVAVSADGRIALSGSDDKTIRVWDLATRKQLRVLKGHAARVTSIEFIDPDTAVSGSVDGTVRLWDVETGRQLRCLKQSSKQSITLSAQSQLGSQFEFATTSLGVTKVAIDRKRRSILAGSWDDQAVLIWPVSDDRTPTEPPRVHVEETANPYRDFDPSYASVGLRVIRDGPDQGDIDVVM